MKRHRFSNVPDLQNYWYLLISDCTKYVFCTHFDFDTTSGKTDGKLLTGMKNHLIQPSFRHKRVQHKQGRNTIKYRGKVRGMDDHFDTSGVFEISKFDISKFACTFMYMYT